MNINMFSKGLNCPVNLKIFRTNYHFTKHQPYCSCAHTAPETNTNPFPAPGCHFGLYFHASGYSLAAVYRQQIFCLKNSPLKHILINFKFR